MVLGDLAVGQTPGDQPGGSVGWVGGLQPHVAGHQRAFCQRRTDQKVPGGDAPRLGGAGGGNDVGHLVLSGATGLFILAQMGSAAAAFGKRFRLYSLASAATVLVFAGVLTGREAAKLAKGEPTPWMGLYERIGMGAWLLWIVVLAINLLRTAQEGNVWEPPLAPQPAGCPSFLLGGPIVFTASGSAAGWGGSICRLMVSSGR